MSSEWSALQGALRSFAESRDWERFHTPKNLAMAVAGEAGELCAELQWLSDDEASRMMQDGSLTERMALEAADVLLYLIRFADVCGIDLLDAAARKVAMNGERYPISLSKGRATKYNRLEEES